MLGYTLQFKTQMYPIEPILKGIGLFALYPICKIIYSHINKYIYWHWIPVGWKITKIKMRDVFPLEKVSLPETLEHLVMHKVFDSQIELPKNLLRLDMGDYFDQPVILPDSLKYLTMGYRFNQPIAIPNPLKHLTMGDFFDQPIILPETLEYLSVGNDFNQHIALPKALIHLSMGNRFDKIITFPNTLRSLVICNSCYRHKLILPESLVTFAFPDHNAMDQELVMWYCDNLPNSVKILITDGYIGVQPLVNLPNSIKYLIEIFIVGKPRVFNNKYVEIKLTHDEREKLDKIIKELNLIEE